MPSVDARAKEVDVTDDELVVLLADGRRISAPLAWFPRLLMVPPPHSARTSNSLAKAWESTGPMSTKI